MQAKMLSFIENLDGSLDEIFSVKHFEFRFVDQDYKHGICHEVDLIYDSF